MATNTPNINLVLPIGSEKVSRQVINDNNTKIDTALGAVPSGQNLQGEIESLNNNITTLNNKSFKVLTATTNFNDITTAGAYCFDWVSNGTNYNRPVNQGGLLTVDIGSDTYTKSQHYTDSNGRVFARGYHDGAWTSWQELALKSDTSIGMQRIASGSDADNLYSDNMRVAFYAASHQVTHLPTADWYFIMSFRAETSYITQIAFGMTGSGIYWRRYNIGTVGATWAKIV